MGFDDDRGVRGRVPEAAGTVWGPVTGLPLPEAVRDLLASLTPGRGSQGRAPWLESLAQQFTEIGELASRQWMGLRPPTLSSLRGPEMSEHFLVHRGDPALTTPDHRGPDGRLTVIVAYVPASVDWDTTRAADLQRAGGTSLRVSIGPGIPGPSHPTQTLRLVTSGDATTVDVCGTLVRVQHRRPGLTRLAWALRRELVAAEVEVMIPRQPVFAVHSLLDSDVFTESPPTR